MNSVRIGNQWRSIEDIQVRVGGSWRQADEVHVRVGGQWRKSWEKPGLTWTVRPSPSPSYWYSVTYGNGLFVAVARSRGSNDGSPRIMTSPDGVTWTVRTAPALADWSCVAYGNNRFVAGSYDGLIMISEDGVKWTEYTFESVQNIKFVNNMFVAMSPDGTDRIYTSTDGVNWSVKQLPISNYWTDIVYGKNLFVVVGNSMAAISVDGNTWTSYQLHGSGIQTDRIAYGNGLFISTALLGGQSYLTSPEGTQSTWTIRNFGVGGYWRGVAYGAGMFVVIADDKVITSTSGTGNWVQRASIQGDVRDITFGAGKFVIVGRDFIMTSG